jgi:hypothetical protein
MRLCKEKYQILGMLLIICLVIPFIPASTFAIQDSFPNKIRVDGRVKDWNGVPSLSSGSENTIGLWSLQSANTLFLMAKGSNIEPCINFYIDSDNNSKTGRIKTNWQNCGADYLVENGGLYKWQDDDWEFFKSIDFIYSDTVVELSISLDDLGLSGLSSIRVAYTVDDNNPAPAWGKELPENRFFTTANDGPFEDELVFDGDEYNETNEYYQHCLKALGYTDKYNEELDIDGHFGSKSRSALNKYIVQNNFDYVSKTAVEKLMADAEATADGFYDNGLTSQTIGLDPVAFLYFDVSNYKNSNDPFFSMKAIKALPYIVTPRPEEMNYTQKRVMDYVNSSTRIYGYVNLGPDNPEDSQSDWEIKDMKKAKEQVDDIAAAGWYGVFIDQAGYDFHETRARQNELFDYIHSKGLFCFVNAWFPEDVLGSEVKSVANPNGTKSHLGDGDLYLLESFFSRTTGLDAKDYVIDKYIKAKEMADKIGVGLAGLSYKRNTVSWDNATKDIEMSYVLAQCLGMTGWWFGGDSTKNGTYYGRTPDINLGNEVVKYLSKTADNKYMAETDKYQITFYTGKIPQMYIEEKK